MSNETFIAKRFGLQERLMALRAKERAHAPPPVETVQETVVATYRGVYRTGEHYKANSSATWGGSVWIAREDTDESPGGGSVAWQLAVKRGGQGEPGPRGSKGEQGPEGPPGPKPDHKWVDGTKLSFERPDGTFEKPVDLRGPPGSPGGGGGTIIVQSWNYMPSGW